jgi:hypothetical protein
VYRRNVEILKRLREECRADAEFDDGKKSQGK